MLPYLLRGLVAEPLETCNSLLDKWVYPWLLQRTSGVRLEGTIHLNGRPLVQTTPGAEIRIGTNVTLGSRNRGYHVNMHSPVKLFADKPAALIEIGRNTRIHGACLHAYKHISIGRNCLIAANTQIMDCTGHDASFPDVANRINTTGIPRRVTIEDSVWIGANSIVLPGAHIGWGSIVAAGSVVFRGRIPPCCTVAGNPAVVILTRPRATGERTS